ncbi:glutaredoxin family protein [Lentibacillus salicampi]|uniref:Glutaredoxin family protein n=1 Tax=Lentibacillus salicampi TaxID=175306 RepID=A0A4Y9AC05_9BACI|nr:glutaredoxin family protein [Lentibacillus salicampi]TFJ93353.1 glutaredoxin family protein [Lentibacillus salicampi]
MQHVIFYTKENCSLCDDARTMLELLNHDYPLEIEERDIYTTDEWLEKYHLQIPVVQLKNTTLNCEQISYKALEQALGEIGD